MKLRECSIGDEIVILHSTIYSNGLAGKTGRVIVADPWKVGVEFDEYIYGHTCDGNGQYGHCWFLNPCDTVDLIATEPDIHNFDEIDSGVIDMFLKRFKKGCIESGGI